MGCLLGKQDINDIHPDIFSVHNIDHEVCLICFYFTLKVLFGGTVGYFVNWNYDQNFRRIPRSYPFFSTGIVEEFIGHLLTNVIFFCDESIWH